MYPPPPPHRFHRGDTALNICCTSCILCFRLKHRFYLLLFVSKHCFYMLHIVHSLSLSYLFGSNTVSLIFRRLACLKYLVLANMLMKSGINPFDSQEVCTATPLHQYIKMCTPKVCFVGGGEIVISTGGKPSFGSLLIPYWGHYLY